MKPISFFFHTSTPCFVIILEQQKSGLSKTWKCGGMDVGSKGGMDLTINQTSSPSSWCLRIQFFSRNVNNNHVLLQSKSIFNNKEMWVRYF